MDLNPTTLNKIKISSQSSERRSNSITSSTLAAPASSPTFYASTSINKNKENTPSLPTLPPLFDQEQIRLRLLFLTSGLQQTSSQEASTDTTVSNTPDLRRPKSVSWNEPVKDDRALIAETVSIRVNQISLSDDKENYDTLNSLIVADEDTNVSGSGSGTGDNSSKLQNKVSLTNSLTDVNEDLLNSEKSGHVNEIGRVTKWATGFEKLLEDPLGLQIFTDFLKKEFSEENINFWVKCENFKKLAEPGEMRAESQAIWSVYLDTASMHQINVDNKARSFCREAMTADEPHSAMFEPAQSQIFALMKYDSYSRFLKSPMYKECIVNEMEGKPILSPTPPTTATSKPSSGVKARLSVATRKGGGEATRSGSGETTNAGDEDDVSTPNSVEFGATSSNTLYSPANASQMTFSLNVSSNNLTPGQQSPSSSKEKKKMSTILPWTKGPTGEENNQSTKGKEKKPSAPEFNHQGSDVQAQANLSTQQHSPNPLVANHTNNRVNVLLNGPKIAADLSMNEGNSQNNKQLLNEYGLNDSTLDTSANLTAHIENKFCRVLCNNDGSSTMIQAVSGQTVYQALSKMFNKKNIPWYKCDLYFVGDYQPINQHSDAQILGSKEICLVERCLFVLSLIPIAINLCVKVNLKKTIQAILQPILDFYQIKTNNCAIYLNTTGNLLNLNDLCSIIDNQHVLIVHKHQTNLLSNEEVDKFISMSVMDFIPTNLSEFHFQFDELGILKQQKSKNSLCSPTSANSHPSSGNSAIQSNAQQQQPQTTRITLKPVNEEEQGGEKCFIDLLKRAQNFSLDDQRGRIDSKHLQVPEFLLAQQQNSSLSSSPSYNNINNGLISDNKTQSLSQNDLTTLNTTPRIIRHQRQQQQKQQQWQQKQLQHSAGGENINSKSFLNLSSPSTARTFSSINATANTSMPRTTAISENQVNIAEIIYNDDEVNERWSHLHLRDNNITADASVLSSSSSSSRKGGVNKSHMSYV